MTKEQSPFRNTMGVANEGCGWQLLRSAWHAEQLQACLVRQAVAFAGVYGFAGPNQIFPCVFAAARTGHDVIPPVLQTGYALEFKGVISPSRGRPPAQ